MYCANQIDRVWATKNHILSENGARSALKSGTNLNDLRYALTVL